MGRKYPKKNTNKINSYDLFNRKKTSNVLSDIDLGCINKKKKKKSDKQKFNQEPSRSFKSFMKLVERQSDPFEGFRNNDSDDEYGRSAGGKQNNNVATKQKSRSLETQESPVQISGKAKKFLKNRERSGIAPTVKQKGSKKPGNGVQDEQKPRKQEQTSGQMKSKSLKHKNEKDVGGIFKQKLTKHQKRREEMKFQEKEARRLKIEDRQKDLQEKRYFTDKVSLNERVDCPPVLRTPVEKIKTKSLKLDGKQKSVEKCDSFSAKISNWGKNKKQLSAGGSLTPVRPKTSELSNDQLQMERERVMEQYRLIKLNRMKTKNKLTPVEI